MATGDAREARWDAAWYAGFAVVALAVWLLDEAPLARNWGLMASVGYSVGALASLLWSSGLIRRTAVALVVFAGAVLLPLGLELWWRAENGLGTHAKSETVVTEEAARAFLEGGDPYATDFSSGPLGRFPAGVDTHVPYLPGNLAFGVGRPLLGDGVAGDARIVFAAVFLGAVVAALRLSRAPSGEQLRAFMLVVVSPLGARYIVGGGNDLPVIGGMLLSLVLVDRRRPGGAGLAAGLAAAVKLTAWPLLPFVVVVARDRAGRPARWSTATIAAAVIATAVVPFLLVDAAAMLEDVVRYPLGLTEGGTPASSPTLGGLLGRMMPEARTEVAVAAGVVVGVMTLWLLVRRTPRSARDAARATVLVLLAATVLATAGRFGYLVYVIDLWLWSTWILREDRPVQDARGRDGEEVGSAIPMPNELDTRWKLRFTAPELGLPRWADAAPDRLAFVSTESGVRQVWSLDLTTGERRQASNDDVGVEHVLVAPDGRVAWWFDAVGDERGRWVALPFDGGEPAPLVPGVPDGWSMGVAMVNDTVALGLSTDDDYRVYVAVGAAPARLIYRHEQPVGVGRSWPEGAGGLSADGALLCVRHAEHGDILHYALRVLDVATGKTVADLEDPGRTLDPVAWSHAGSRLLFTSELGPYERPAVWDPVTGERRDLPVDLPGAVIPLDWYPDGSAVLARHEHEAIDRLCRVDVASGRATPVADPGGEIGDAAVRPDGEVWLTVSDTTHPLRPETASGHPVFETPGDPPPPGRPYTSYRFTNGIGDPIQAFLVTPEGIGPFPIVMHAHGGPEWHHRVRWEPEIQALADAGFAVALVNYRGSTGYGVAFRERLVCDPWLPESDDVIACLDALIADGVADGDRAFLAGWSWGGCLACLNLGLHPDRWRAVFAGIPAGDFVAAHWASMPTIRAYDATLYGGDPTELPDLWRERNPMTYVDEARAPLLVIAGEKDPRCPPEGITPFTDALRTRGVDVEMYMYPAGHHANATDERVRHVEMIREFFLRH